jgi:hypothetical protein
MPDVKLHLDADTSRVSLWRSLLMRGFDVTRTPNEWMAADAGDQEQLLGATAQGRCIFTFNVRDFVVLAQQFPHHAGILLSTQRPLSELLQGLDRLLTETAPQDWIGQVRWLSDWIH